MEKTTNQVEASGVPDPEQEACNKKFGEELESLVNRYSLENKSNTPDFILAELMVNCLSAFEAASLRREAWFGVSLDVARDWEEEIRTAIDQATKCWSNLAEAGVFDRTLAKQIGDDLIKYLRNQGGQEGANAG